MNGFQLFNKRSATEKALIIKPCKPDKHYIARIVSYDSNASRGTNTTIRLQTL